MTFRLVRVIGPNFVAGFVEIDDKVRRAAPILRKHLLGKTEQEARDIIRRMGWKASVVAATEKGGLATDAQILVGSPGRESGL